MLRYVLRVTLATALFFGVSTLAVAQYGGMPRMPGMPGTRRTLLTHTAQKARSSLVSWVQRLAAASFTGSSTIEPRCKAASAAMETSLSAIRTTAPIHSLTTKRR